MHTLRFSLKFLLNWIMPFGLDWIRKALRNLGSNLYNANKEGLKCFSLLNIQWGKAETKCPGGLGQTGECK
jgi:hypothetical protein